MSYAYAKELDSKKIPIIDIASLRDGSNKISVAKKLHQANKNLGFLYISNHGISNKTITKTRQYGLQFFNKKIEELKNIEDDLKLLFSHVSLNKSIKFYFLEFCYLKNFTFSSDGEGFKKIKKLNNGI